MFADDRMEKLKFSPLSVLYLNYELIFFWHTVLKGA